MSRCCIIVSSKSSGTSVRVQRGQKCHIRALSALEFNDVHMLVWGGTKMGGFFNSCNQCSDILVPFMDTLVTGNIRSEETPFLLSPMGIFLPQLMADLHLFMDDYLHKTDSDIVLACETKGIVEKTISIVLDAQAPNVRKFLIPWMLIAITISLLVQKK